MFMLYRTPLAKKDWIASATQSISLRDSLSFQTNFATTNSNDFKRINTNSPLLCTQLLGHLPAHEKDQNRRLCTPSYYWWGYYEQLDLDGHNPYLTNISCQMRSPEACLLVEWLWTGHRVSGKHLKCHFWDCAPSCTGFLIRSQKFLGWRAQVRDQELNTTHWTTLICRE